MSLLLGTDTAVGTSRELLLFNPTQEFSHPLRELRFVSLSEMPRDKSFKSQKQDSNPGLLIDLPSYS